MVCGHEGKEKNKKTAKKSKKRKMGNAKVTVTPAPSGANIYRPVETVGKVHFWNFGIKWSFIIPYNTTTYQKRKLKKISKLD
jgi:hypothetical protein